MCANAIGFLFNVAKIIASVFPDSTILYFIYHMNTYTTNGVNETMDYSVTKKPSNDCKPMCFTNNGECMARINPSNQKVTETYCE